MSHFAKIDKDNIVTQVIVAEQDFINSGAMGDSTDWIETSKKRLFRKNYAGIGHTYDAARDAFIPPKPYPSWTLNEDTCDWDAPTASPHLLPQDEAPHYEWNEDTQAWDASAEDENG